MIRSDGTHTFSAGMVLTHKQFRNIWGACYKSGCIKDDSKFWENTWRLYCYAFQDQGVKVYLSGRPGKLYRLRVIFLKLTAVAYHIPIGRDSFLS